MGTETVTHPSRFNTDVLDAMVPTLLGWDLPIHDPFAGTGERLGALATRLGLTFSGTEIEPEFIVDFRVVPGDATRAESYPFWRHCVVTSPVYPNGMADHFHAQDTSKRHTYRQALAETIGHDRELHGHNMGRYGPRGGKEAARAHWALASMAVLHWPDHVLVNVKDFIIAGTTYQVVNRWRLLLQGAGYAITTINVPVRGQGFGANRDARVDYETILVGERIPTNQEDT